jgi:hypothetical protein
MSIVRSVLFAGVVLTMPMSGSAARVQEHGRQHFSHGASPASSVLVRKVREATQGFWDVRQAVAAKYGQFLGCVSGPQEGAMGVHFVNSDLVGDGELDVSHPEALIYEVKNNVYRLVGVEYIVMADAWNSGHNQPPVLEGQVFQYNGSPNRYGLPAFYELHVWAWRDNPHGAFVDWNTRVSCEDGGL